MNVSKTYNILISVALILLSSRAYSNDQEIRQRFKKLNELTSFEVSFKQIKTLKELNFTIRSSGDLKILKPSNILWRVTQPSYLEVNISSNKVVILSKEMDGTTQKQTYKYSGMPKNTQGYSSLLSLMSLLTMDVEQLLKEYDIVKKAPEEFLFTPKLRSDIFKNVLVQLTSNSLIKKVELQEISGDTIQINFQDYKINK